LNRAIILVKRKVMAPKRKSDSADSAAEATPGAGHPAAPDVPVRKPKAPGRSITVKDIAAEVGVSITTVSNVLLGKEGTYSPETGEKVKESARRLGYRRNNLARSLVRQRSQTLGVLLEERFNFSHPENQYFVGFLQGFLQEAARRRYQVKIVMQANPPSDEIISAVDDASIDGLAAVVLSPDNALFGWFDHARLPVVLVGCETRSPKASSVDVDDYESLGELIEQAWSLGHRRFALVTGENEHGALSERERAFNAHVGGRRVDGGAPMVLRCDMEGHKADEVLKGLAKLGPAKRPSILVCANDLIAVSIIRQAAAHGLRVPEDFSVTGFDGFAVGDWCTPRLATVRQPLSRIGAKAAEILIESLENPGEAPIQHAVLPGRLLLRESLAAPAAP
jgi:LacI family transcriptional regulator